MIESLVPSWPGHATAENLSEEVGAQTIDFIRSSVKGSLSRARPPAARLPTCPPARICITSRKRNKIGSCNDKVGGGEREGEGEG